MKRKRNGPEYLRSKYDANTDVLITYSLNKQRVAEYRPKVKELVELHGNLRKLVEDMTAAQQGLPEILQIWSVDPSNARIKRAIVDWHLGWCKHMGAKHGDPILGDRRIETGELAIVLLGWSKSDVYRFCWQALDCIDEDHIPL